MKVTQLTRNALAWRRQERELKALGYRRHECDWEIVRGGRYDEVIVDVQISTCGKYVWTLLGKPEPAPVTTERRITRIDDVLGGRGVVTHVRRHRPPSAVHEQAEDT